MSYSTGPVEMEIREEADSGERFGRGRFFGGHWETAPWLRWSIYLLIAGFCLYRISIFRPIPLDDTSGALRPLLYQWFVRYRSHFADPVQAFRAWSNLCLCGLLSCACLAVLNYFWRENMLRLPNRLARLLCSPALFWTLLAFTSVLCQLPALLHGELNPDESQFLVAADKLFYDHNFFRSVNTGTSGPFNIYPLMLPAVFGLSPDFASSRLTGVIAVLLSTFWLYRALTLVGNERLARLAILPVAGTLALWRHGELVHNSSEHIPSLLVALAIYQGAKLIMDTSRHLAPSFFWIGFIASAAYLAKMQAVPIIVGVGAVSFAYLWSAGYGSRVWRAVWTGLAGVLTPLLWVIAFSAAGGVFRIFWRDYVRGNLIYTAIPNLGGSMRLFSEYVTALPEVHIYLLTISAIVVAYLIVRLRRSVSAAHTLLVELLVVAIAISASVFLPSADRSNLYVYMAAVSLWAAPAYFALLFLKRSSRRDPVRWFGLLAFVSACTAFYSIYKPHRYFLHYLVFLYVPLAAVVGYLLIRVSREEGSSFEAETDSKFRWLSMAEQRLAFVSAALILSLGCEVYLWNLQAPADLDAPPILRTAEGYFIRYLTDPGSQIFVWGWNLNPFLSSGRVPSTRDTNVAGLFQSYRGILPPVNVPTPATERLSDIYRRRLLTEFQSKPPALFIDAIGQTSWFLREREFWTFELIPSIKEFVDQRYVHLIDIYGQRYFLRRDLAAKRETEFNRPMPEIACSPSAVRCSDRPITLPTELPVTNIPRHARIDVEFMPIHHQLGPATVFNTEKTPFSFRGLRLQHLNGDRYFLLIGLGDSWAKSKEFSAPQGKVSLVSIELNERMITIKQNEALVDEVHLARPFADAGGPVTLESWIGGVDPFSGKVQFLQIMDLDKPEGRLTKALAKPH